MPVATDAAGLYSAYFEKLDLATLASRAERTQLELDGISAQMVQLTERRATLSMHLGIIEKIVDSRTPPAESRL
jgi:hypothetical protein